MNPSKSQSPSEPVRIWLVEDNDTFLRLLKRLCTEASSLRCGHAFTNAEAMLAVLREARPTERPEVLLLDVGLPGKSGLEIIAEITTLAPACRILILTVFEDEAKIAQAISAGACGYLLKTARPEDIVKAVHEAAGGGSPMSPNVARSVVNILARLTKPVQPVAMSPRERELLVLLVEGLTAKEISERLGLSIHTTDTHTRHLFAKLGVHSRAAAVARALRERLL